MDLFSEIIPSLLQKSNNILDEESEKDYIPYVVNKSLSGHIDCLFHVNAMNNNSHLDKKLQYDYLYHSLKHYKRPYQKWMKSVIHEDIKVIQEYYGYNITKSKQVLDLLSSEQLSKIKSILNKGGNSK